MIELAEACVLSRQLHKRVCFREIRSVTMNHTPHKFAFYADDPHACHEFLKGRSFDGSRYYGGMVELAADTYRLVFSDGVNLRFHEQPSQQPEKHQMLIEFSDGSFLSGSVQMYGGLWCFHEGSYENQYRQIAMEKPSPLSAAFSQSYFRRLIDDDSVQNISLKRFLATEQRIPGLGNGMLQDILWQSRLHPKRKVISLTGEEKDRLFSQIRELAQEMVSLGGRDTEKDLYGQYGGYETHMSKLHLADGCTACGSEIVKESYMGGSIYYCPVCQKYP